MSERELLPCPFCGSDDAPDLLDADAFGPLRGIDIKVACDVGAGGCGGGGRYCRSVEEAVAAWNRRTPQVKPQTGLTPNTVDEVEHEPRTSRSVEEES